MVDQKFDNTSTRPNLARLDLFEAGFVYFNSSSDVFQRLFGLLSEPPKLSPNLEYGCSLISTIISEGAYAIFVLQKILNQV